MVYPTYYGCRADYTIAGTNDKLISDWAQARKVKLLPRINCQATAVLHAFLTDPTRRTNVLNQLMSIVTTNNYDGLNIDFESGSDKDRAALTTFIQMLGTRYARCRKEAVGVRGSHHLQPDGGPRGLLRLHRPGGSLRLHLRDGLGPALGGLGARVDGPDRVG